MPHFQALAGDSTDKIPGCEGVGAKNAHSLILAHGDVWDVIAAAKDNRADVSQKKRLAIVAFEEVAELMLQLTTLRTDLDVPMTTTIRMRDVSNETDAVPKLD